MGKFATDGDVDSDSLQTRWMYMDTELLASLVRKLDRIELTLAELTQHRSAKEWYSTAELAALVGKAEFTVREWCRLGRIHAEKRATGRGQSQEWMIAHAEVQRYRNEGLVPAKN